MIIAAPIEMYTPLPVFLSSCCKERTSFRRSFFSDELRLEISIAFISFSLDMMASPSAGGLLTGISVGVITVAFD